MKWRVLLLMAVCLSATRVHACVNGPDGQWFYAWDGLPHALPSSAVFFGFRVERIGGRIFDLRISDGQTAHFHALLEQTGKHGFKFLDIHDNHRVVLAFERLNDCVVRVGSRLAIRHAPDIEGLWFLDVAPVGALPLTRRERARE